jgi:hypothetical protein
MKIRCLLAILAINSVLCAPIQAQDEMETRHEIAVSYGAVPNSIWIDVLSDVVPAVFGQKYDNNKYVGPIGLEYYYHTSPLLGVGAVAVFTTNNEDVFVKETLDSYRSRSYFTFMPSVKFNWLRKHNWGMYSKVAVGATFARFADQDYNENGKKVGEKDVTNDVLFNFQASLIGVEVGNDHVRGFAELGVGEQGIALAGVRFKF